MRLEVKVSSGVHWVQLRIFCSGCLQVLKSNKVEYFLLVAVGSGVVKCFSVWLKLAGDDLHL